jgi:hypothetical protein
MYRPIKLTRIICAMPRASLRSVLHGRGSLVFRAAFAMIADKAGAAANDDHAKRVLKGAKIVLDDAAKVNLHMHTLLYGLIKLLMDDVMGQPAENEQQVRINVLRIHRHRMMPRKDAVLSGHLGLPDLVQNALHRRPPLGTNVLATSGEQSVFVKRKIKSDLSDKSLIRSKHYRCGGGSSPAKDEPPSFVCI